MVDLAKIYRFRMKLSLIMYATLSISAFPGHTYSQSSGWVGLRCSLLKSEIGGSPVRDNTDEYRERNGSIIALNINISERRYQRQDDGERTRKIQWITEKAITLYTTSHLSVDQYISEKINRHTLVYNRFSDGLMSGNIWYQCEIVPAFDFRGPPPKL